MQLDSLLSTVLKNYHQTNLSLDEINQTYSSTISLLTTLNNPLNVTLLTSHLLIAPAIWNRVEGVSTSFRVISLFNTAALTINKQELQEKKLKHTPRVGIRCDDWARAVVKGLDDKSARWQHALVLAGLLLGMKGWDKRGLTNGLRESLANAMVMAVNKSLQQPSSSGVVAASSLALIMNYTFSIISDDIRRNYDYENLLPVMIRAMTSTEGFQDGTFLAAINSDLKITIDKKLDWPLESSSFKKIQELKKKPLMVSMGSLSQLIAHAIENIKSPFKVIQVREHLHIFTSGLLDRWKKIEFSAFGHLDEANMLTPETAQITLPLLWQIFKTIMFTTIVIMRAVIERTLIDPVLSFEQHALITASQTLLVLKNINFITSRLGTNQFSAYAFVNFSSIDILCHHPSSAVDFLQSIYPSTPGIIPPSAFERDNDLFYLNTAEHLAKCLGPGEVESLIIPVCTVYLSPQENLHFLETFEAAHSVMFSIFSSPQNSRLTAKLLPSYVEKLFASFPVTLSPEQFRFAFKALIQICTPPHPLATSHPMMAETLLEALRYRVLGASTKMIAPRVSGNKVGDAAKDLPLSEQSVLLLALIDSLPYTSLAILEVWLGLASDLLNAVSDKKQKEVCQKQFWDILESGEMDIERGVICVSWWTSKGGRERVLSPDINRDSVLRGELDARKQSKL